MNFKIVFQLLIFISIALYAEDISALKNNKCISIDSLKQTIKNNNLKKFEKDIRLACNAYKLNSSDETILFDAVKQHSNDIVSFLIGYGFSINDVNIDGQTALHIAAKYNFSDIVTTLIKNGAKDLNDNFGYTAAWYAYSNNSLESLEIINNYNNSNNHKEKLDSFIRNFHKLPIDEI